MVLLRFVVQHKRIRCDVVLNKIYFNESMLLELKEMLYSSKYSKKEICQYFNVSEDVIDRLRRENNFVYNRKEKQYDEYIFTD